MVYDNINYFKNTNDYVHLLWNNGVEYNNNIDWYINTKEKIFDVN